MTRTSQPAPTDRRERLLYGLGKAVRTLRTERGLTLRELAQRAHVSERFLIQLEAGTGNVSVARLDDIAAALSSSCAQLLSLGSGFDEGSPRGTATVDALCGLRGAGKSTVGKKVAECMGCSFVELDEAIVREAQMSLSSIFEIHGEAYYRTLERDVLLALIESGKPMILATGGSIVTDAETWSLLRSRTKTVWLKATAREHWDRVVAQGDVRPMKGRPRARNELSELLRRRAPLYARCEHVVETSKRSVDEVTRAVRALGQPLEVE